MPFRHPPGSVQPSPYNPRKKTLEELEPLPTVHMQADGKKLSCVSGSARLQAQLSLHGQAEVVDIDTGRTLVIQDTGASLVVATPEAARETRNAAEAVVALASRASRKN